MIERRELTQVIANGELAERLLATARQHAVSAEQLAASDPYLAYSAVHDAIRQALSALLRPVDRISSTRDDRPAAQAIIDAAG